MQEKKLWMIFWSLLMTHHVLGQEITGKIVDADMAPVEFATVVLQTPDSAFVCATITDTSGVFSLKAEQGKYRLVIQHLLFETKEIELSGSNAGLIVLAKKENRLDEIVVRKQRPLVKIEGGKFTYNLSNIAGDKAVSNAYESVLHLPGIREQNGALFLSGTSKLTVILNGKPTTMSNEQLVRLLKNIPSSRVDKAEVMYSAPPQYHVRGAVINLVLTKWNGDNSTLQGEINSSYNQKYYAGGRSGISLSYGSGSFFSDLVYSFDENRDKNGLDLSSFHTFNDSVYSIVQHNHGSVKQGTHHIRFAVDFQPDSVSKLSLVYTSELTPSLKKKEDSEGNFSESETYKTGNQQMHNVELAYQSGFGLKAGLNYTFYNSPSDMNFRNRASTGESTDWVSNSGQRINRLEAYADQSHELAGSWKFNYGADFTYANDHDFQKYISNDGTDLSASNTDSRITEYTCVIYSGFEKSFNSKFSVNFSLSGEYYNRSSLVKWSVFPATEITYVFSTDHILQLAVSSDKTYPDYWEMQESVSYLNGYAEIRGNPALIPFKDYSAHLSYILKSRYTFSAFFSYMPDYFVQLPYQSSDRLALVYQTLNWDYMKNAGIDVEMPFSFGKILKSGVTLVGFYNRVKNDNFHDIPFDRKKWVMYSRLDNTLNICSDPDLKMEATAFYLTPSLQGIYDLSSIWSLDAGIKWTLSGGKGELKLKGSDLVNSSVPDPKIRYADQNVNMAVFKDSRMVRLSFVWKFGGYEEKKRQHIDTSRFGHE